MKEGEFLCEDIAEKTTWLVRRKDPIRGKVKWQVGRDYCVSLGGGKPGLWYCPKCRTPMQLAIKPHPKDTYERLHYKDFPCYFPHRSKENNCGEIVLIPLRIAITSIKKERLLDISEADAKKEGFSGDEFRRVSDDFIDAFYRINHTYAPKESRLRMSLKELKNYKFKPLKFGSYIYSKNYVTIVFDWNPWCWVLDFCVKGVKP